MVGVPAVLTHRESLRGVRTLHMSPAAVGARLVVSLLFAILAHFSSWKPPRTASGLHSPLHAMFFSLFQLFDRPCPCPAPAILGAQPQAFLP
jgi:hypothetical protein